MAKESKAIVTCSPVDKSVSSSLPLASTLIDFANSVSLLVSPCIAETTTTISLPFFFDSIILLATFLIFSMVPMDEPPYF